MLKGASLKMLLELGYYLTSRQNVTAGLGLVSDYILLYPVVSV